MSPIAPERMRWYGERLALFGALVGLVSFVGQLLGVGVLATYAPERPVLQPLAALILVLGGLAVFASARAYERAWRRVIAVLLGGLVFVVAALVSMEYLTGIDVGIDGVFPPTIHDGGPNPGRPSPLSTLAHLLIGTAVLVFDVRLRRGLYPREWLLMATLFVAFVAGVGHLFGVRALYDVDPYPLRGVSIPGAISMAATAAGGLLMRSSEGAMSVITSRGPGGVLVRRLGATALVVVPVASLAILWLVGLLGLRDLSLVAGLAAVAAVAIAMVLIGATAVPLERSYEAELETRQRIEELLAGAPMGVFVADLSGRYLEVNDAGCRLLGWPRDEIVRRTIMDLIPPEEVERLVRVRERLLSGEVDVDRWSLLRSDGTFVPVEVTAKILPDGRWQAFVADIRLRIGLEERLKTSLSEMEFLSHAGVELAACLEIQATVDCVVRLATERLGEVASIDVLEHDELRRIGFGDTLGIVEATRRFMAECTVPAGLPHPFREVIETRRAVIVPEVDDELIDAIATTPRHRRALREIGLHSLLLVPLHARGQLMAVMCIGTCDANRTYDAADLRLAEELGYRAAIALDNVRLYQESRLQAAMITKLSEGVFLVRAADRKIVFTNPRFDEMLGYEHGELQGRDVREISAPTDVSAEERIAEVVRAIETYGNWHGEVLNLRKDGTPIWQSVSVSTYEHEEHGRVWIATHSDIDERKRLEAESERTLKEKEILLKEVHHRVKNNLQVISSLFALQRARATNDDVRNMLEESRMRIQSIALVHEQLYHSTDLAAVDFDEYLRGLVGAIRTSYAAEAISIETRAEDVVLDIEEAVPSALILAELIANSLKHAFRGGTGKVLVTAHRDEDGQYVLEVADDGVGIPKDFDWTRAHSLGLRIVRDLARQLRGSVELDRTHGTRFTVRFPPRHVARRFEHAPTIEA
jgi:PAS domain S-box-containing protein